MYVASQGGRPISVEKIKAVKNRFRLGQKIRLIEQGSRKSKRYVRGRVIARTKYFVTIMVSKNGTERYKESFKYVDFLLGDIEKVI